MRSYITPDLKEGSQNSDGTGGLELEYEIFAGLRLEVAEQAELIRNVSRAVAADVLCSLQQRWRLSGYCRPIWLKARDYDLTGVMPWWSSLLAGFV